MIDCRVESLREHASDPLDDHSVELGKFDGHDNLSQQIEDQGHLVPALVHLRQDTQQLLPVREVAHADGQLRGRGVLRRSQRKSIRIGAIALTKLIVDEILQANRIVLVQELSVLQVQSVHEAFDWTEGDIRVQLGGDQLGQLVDEVVLILVEVIQSDHFLPNELRWNIYLHAQQLDHVVVSVNSFQDRKFSFLVFEVSFEFLVLPGLLVPLAN